MGKRVPFIEQMTQTECGLCCCLSILKYYKGRETLYELRNDVECGRDGYSLSKLRELMEKRNFEVKTYKIKDICSLKGINVPIILYWNNNHFVILYKITNHDLYIMNPACGYEKYSIEDAVKHFSNAVMIAKPNADYLPRKSTVPSPWKMVFSVFVDNKWWIMLAILFTGLSYIVVIKLPDQTSNIINKTIANQGFANIKTAIIMIAALGCLYFISFFVRSMSIMMSNIIFSRKLGKKTFWHILRLPYKFFEIRTVGDIIYRLTSLNAFRELLASQVISGVVESGIIVAAICFIWGKSPYLCIAAIILSIINFAILIITKNPLSTSINNEIQKQAEMSAIETESITTISTVKTSGVEQDMYNLWLNSFQKLLDSYKKRYSISNIYGAITGTFQMFAPIVILISGIYLYYEGTISVGEIVAIQSLSSTLFLSETSLFTAYTQFLLAETYLNRVNDIWCEKEEKSYSNTKKIEIEGSIECKNLKFSYSKNSVEVLHNINLKIEKGKRVAFVGKSGSGKSSIAKIIAGLYQIEDNMLFFDGVDINEIKKESISQQISIVPQEIYLLNRSIMENITIGNSKVTEQEIFEVCKKINIYKEISEMPMGFNTIVSEMGLNLSGGQRQRIALVKALVNDPKIIILDEATSSLDAVNEKRVIDYLTQKGCTQVIIAHRLSTIIDADYIYVMKNGEIVEHGKHEELLDLEGEYYKLYQTGNLIEEDNN